MPKAEGDAAVLDLPADISSLEKFRDFVLSQAEDRGLPPALGPKLDLVLEEVLVNVINYAYPQGDGAIRVACLTENAGGKPRVCVRIEDWGPAFDPFDREDPDVEEAMEERAIGGLGIYFIKEMADEAGYAREGDRNVLTFCFATRT